MSATIAVTLRCDYHDRRTGQCKAVAQTMASLAFNPKAPTLSLDVPNGWDVLNGTYGDLDLRCLCPEHANHG